SLYRLPLRATRRFEDARVRLDRTIRGMIADRRRRGVDGGTDLLSLLLGAGEDERLSDEQIRDEAMTILVAGHETTAVWLTRTMMALARHPDLDAAVRAEIVRVCGGRPLRLEDLPTLDLVHRGLRESL